MWLLDQVRIKEHLCITCSDNTELNSRELGQRHEVPPSSLCQSSCLEFQRDLLREGRQVPPCESRRLPLEPVDDQEVQE